MPDPTVIINDEFGEIECTCGTRIPFYQLDGIHTCVECDRHYHISVAAVEVDSIPAPDPLLTEIEELKKLVERLRNQR